MRFEMYEISKKYMLRPSQQSIRGFLLARRRLGGTYRKACGGMRRVEDEENIAKRKQRSPGKERTYKMLEGKITERGGRGPVTS